MMRFLVLITLVLAPSSICADPQPAPTLKLLTAGKNPTRVLRLTPKVGTRSTIEITDESTRARGAIGNVGPAEPMPSTRQLLECEVTAVEPNGDFRVETVVDKIDVRAPKRTSPAQAQAMKAQLTALVGAKSYAVASDRGVTRESGSTPPQGATDELKQQLQALQGIQSQIMAPFPEQPVGVGARWELTMTVTTPQDGGSLVVNQTATFELVELAGTRGKIAIKLRQTGKTSDGELTMSTTGNGMITFDLVFRSATRARLDTRSETQLKNSRIALGQVNTTKLTITSKPH